LKLIVFQLDGYTCCK